jgi:hypothetical protein
MSDNFRVVLFPGFRFAGWRVNSTGADREAGTLLRDGREGFLVVAEPLHHAHHAVMLAVPTAAWGKICVGIGTEKRCDQRQAEHHHQRKCDGAAHYQATM